MTMRYVMGQQFQNGESVDHSAWWLAVYLLRVELSWLNLKGQDLTLLINQADDICPEQYVEPVYLMLRSAHYESVAWALDQLEIPKEEFLKAVGDSK